MADNKSITFHRKIGLRCLDGGVEGEICDNMHHFRVWLTHDEKKIVKIQTKAIRYPWSICPQAGSELNQLIGMPLDESSAAVGRFTKATLHCTHMFDLAGLLVAHAAHRRAPWEYHCHIGEDGPGRQFATLSRNGQPFLNWHINDGVIEADPPYQGIPLQKQFIQWTEATLDPEGVDAALIMRRAWTIAAARFVDLSVIENAGKLAIPAHCYSLQHDRVDQALPMQKMTRDFDANSDHMLTMWDDNAGAIT